MLMWNVGVFMDHLTPLRRFYGRQLKPNIELARRYNISPELYGRCTGKLMHCPRFFYLKLNILILTII